MGFHQSRRGVSSIQGILMIEPKMDFVEKVCNETWTLEDGKITVQLPGSTKTGPVMCIKFEDMLKYGGRDQILHDFTILNDFKLFLNCCVDLQSDHSSNSHEHSVESSEACWFCGWNSSPLEKWEKHEKTTLSCLGNFVWGELFNFRRVLFADLTAQEVGQWPETRGLGWELWGKSVVFFV